MNVVKEAGWRVVSCTSKFVYDQGMSFLKQLSFTTILVALGLLVLFFIVRKQSLVSVSNDLLDNISVQINKTLAQQKTTLSQKRGPHSIRKKPDAGASSNQQQRHLRLNPETQRSSFSEGSDESTVRHNVEKVEKIVAEDTDDTVTDERSPPSPLSPFASEVYSGSTDEEDVIVKAPNVRQSTSTLSMEMQGLERKESPQKRPYKRRVANSNVDPSTLAPYDARRLNAAETKKTIPQSRIKEPQLPVYAANPHSGKSSPGEECVRRALEKIFGKPFPTKRPSFLKNPETGFNLELDCFNEELGVAAEYQGSQHYHYPNNYHANYKQFTDQLYRDDVKRQLCEDAGVYLIRVPFNVPLQEIEDYVRKRIPESLLDECEC